jgi:serine/threonine protein kinase
VLLVDKTSNNVKIADFGLANALGEASRFQSCVGTTDYSAINLAHKLLY